MTHTPMLAYHNDAAVKSDILAQLEAHRVADEIVQGQYWQAGRGCAVGCTIHSSNHLEYETRFGIPAELARLEDRIFEGLPNHIAKEWPIRFMSAIQPGADLALVHWQFFHWILTDATINPGIAHPLVKDAVANVAALIYQLSIGNPIDKDVLKIASKTAANAACAARFAALRVKVVDRSLLESANHAALAASQAAGAPLGQAYTAVYAARSASYALIGEIETYEKMADRLIQIIEKASQ